MAGTVTSSQPASGYAPDPNLGYGYPAWEATVVRNLITNLNSGNPGKNGQPGSWDSGKYGDWNTYQYKGATGQLGYAETTALMDFVRTGGLDSDSVALGWGSRPPAGANDYVRTAEQSAQDLAWAGYDLNVRQQDFAESKFALDMALKNAQLSFAASGGSGSSGGRSTSSSGGSSSSSGGISDAQAADIALQQARMKLEEELARGRLAMDQAQLAATVAYQNAQLAQNASQFGETMAYNKARDEANNALTMVDLQNKRASEIAALSANPADWVQRDYFLRGRGSPLGERKDAFTGETVQPGELTSLPDLMTEQMGMVPAQTGLSGLNEQGVGVGADQNPAATNPLFDQPVAPVEGFARGTARLSQLQRIPSSNGMVTSPKALVGERRNGKTPGPNAEMLINPTGAPFAIVPNHELPDFRSDGDGGWVPGYATGTSGWDYLYQSGGALSGLVGGGQEEAVPYQTPSYNYVAPPPVQQTQQQTATPPKTTTSVSSNNTTQPPASNYIDDGLGHYSTDGGATWMNHSGGAYQEPAPATPAAPATTNNYAPGAAVPDPTATYYWNGVEWVYGSPSTVIPQTPAQPPATQTTTPPVQPTAQTAGNLPSYDNKGNMTAAGQKAVSDYYAKQAAEAAARATYAEGMPSLSEFKAGMGQMPNAYNPYANEDPNAIVQNKASPYYGMTMAEASKYQNWASATPQGLPDPGLTGAQISQGQTQSVNPRGAGYKPNPADVTAPTPQDISPIDTATALAYPPGKVIDSKDTYKQVIGMGEVRSPDGGGKITLVKGDYQGPPDAQGNPTYYRWDTTLQKYTPIQWTPTIISSEAEWRLLPPEIQQNILSGKSTGYQINTTGTPGIQDWMTNMQVGQASILGGAQAASGIMTEEQFRALPPEEQRRLIDEGPVRSQFGPNISTPASGGWTGANAGGSNGLYAMQELPGSKFWYDNYLTQDEFDALYQEGEPAPYVPPDVMLGMPWGGYDFFPGDDWQYLKPKTGFTSEWVDSGSNATGTSGRQHLATFPNAPSSKRYAVGPDGTVYVSESSGAAWNKATLNEVPEGLISARPEGWQPAGPPAPVDENGLPIQTAEELQAEYDAYIALNPGQPASDRGPAQPPIDYNTWLTTIKNPVQQSTGTRPGTNTGTNTNTGGGGGGGGGGGEDIPTGPGGVPLGSMSIPDLIAFLKGPSGMSVLNYASDVIQNSPSLQFLNGQLPPEQWGYISAQETTVPALGVTLPAPGSLNYGNLQALQAQDPSAFQAMVSLWKAGNRDLQSEMLIARERAPLGSAFNTSLIKTY